MTPPPATPRTSALCGDSARPRIACRSSRRGVRVGAPATGGRGPRGAEASSRGWASVRATPKVVAPSAAWPQCRGWLDAPLTRFPGPRRPAPPSRGATRPGRGPAGAGSAQRGSDSNRPSASWSGWSLRKWGTGARRIPLQGSRSPHVRAWARLLGPGRVLAWLRALSPPRYHLHDP